MSEPKFYICEHCGNIVGKIHDAGVPLMCCGQRKALTAGSAPVVTFALTGDDKPVAVYAYCNLHGLWMAEI